MTYKELCAELTEALTTHAKPSDGAVGYVAGLLTRARAALAEPEPSDLTDEELTEIFNKWWYSKGRALAPGSGDEHIRHFTEIVWRCGGYIPDLPNPRLSHPTP